VFFLSVVLMYLFYIIINQYRGWIVVQDPAITLLGIQAWIPEKALACNFPGWSLSIEFFFYALFPVLYNKVYKKYSLKAISIVIILIWVISQFIMHSLLTSSFYPDNKPFSHNIIYYFPPMHLSQFLV